MDIQTIILGFLMERSMTGYDIKGQFSLSFGFFSGLSYGSIYPALKKMEEQGLITTQVKVQDGAPNKKLCTITDKGREVFHESIRKPLPTDKFKSSFLSRLFFFSHLEQENRMKQAEAYLKSLEDIHERLEDYGYVIRQHADPFQLMCYEAGLRIVEDLKKNVSVCMDELESHEQK